MFRFAIEAGFTMFAYDFPRHMAQIFMDQIFFGGVREMLRLVEEKWKSLFRALIRALRGRFGAKFGIFLSPSN